MSAFVNPDTTAPLEVPCPCPPLANGEARHDHDTIQLRTRLHYGDLQAVSRAGSILGVWDNESATLKLLEIGIVSWTFVDDDGNDVPPGNATIRLLDPGIGKQIQDRLEATHAEATEAMNLPKRIKRAIGSVVARYHPDSAAAAREAQDGSYREAIDTEVQLRTGWRTFDGVDPALVSRLRYRIEFEAAWDDDLPATAHSEIPQRMTARERAMFVKQRNHAQQRIASLFPPDED